MLNESSQSPHEITLWIKYTIGVVLALGLLRELQGKWFLLEDKQVVLEVFLLDTAKSHKIGVGG